MKACTHQARKPIDDAEAFFAAIARREPIVAVTAPAVAASFPGQILRLNAWRKSICVSEVFDASFGAELTVESYPEYVDSAGPETVIAQPCPAIVSYIELYRPELLPYLAPADSQMLHAMKMVREFYPEYRDHKTVVVSPCLAKRRKFDDTGIGGCNVTISSLKNHLEDRGIDLARFDEVAFRNPAGRLKARTTFITAWADWPGRLPKERSRPRSTAQTAPWAATRDQARSTKMRNGAT